MIDRIMGVFRLDINVFEEIEHDPAATQQAGIIVAAVALLSAIAAFIGARAANTALDALGGLNEADIPFADIVQGVSLNPGAAFINALIGAFVGWLLWAALTYFIGTNLYNGEATIEEMLRVIGFAQAPRLLSVFGFIPCLGALLGLIGAIWSLVAGFIAVRQGLDLDNTKTAVTVVLSWLVAVLVNTLVLGPIFALLNF